MIYSIHKGQTAMPPEGFEPEIPASEDRATNGTGNLDLLGANY